MAGDFSCIFGNLQEPDAQSNVVQARVWCTAITGERRGCRRIVSISPSSCERGQRVVALLRGHSQSNDCWLLQQLLLLRVVALPLFNMSRL